MTCSEGTGSSRPQVAARRWLRPPAQPASPRRARRSGRLAAVLIITHRLWPHLVAGQPLAVAMSALRASGGTAAVAAPNGLRNTSSKLVASTTCVALKSVRDSAAGGRGRRQRSDRFRAAGANTLAATL